MNVTPLYDKMIIRPIPAEEKVGSIFIAESTRPKPQKGTVLEVGEGHWDEQRGQMRRLAVTKGDVVLFGKYAGQTITIDTEDLLIVREEEILAIVKPEVTDVAPDAA